MPIGEMAPVPDFSDKRRASRFSQQVANMLNALVMAGYIVRTGPDTFTAGAGSPLTTKGDLYTFDTTNTRLPVGANTYVLTANSAEATGLEWAPASGGIGSDPISSIYEPFSVTGDSDEFDGGSFSGWTAVNSGSHTVVVTQSNNAVSLNHPGSDASAELHAWMKTPASIAIGSYMEVGFRSMGISQNFNQCGVIFANGTTYGAGAQAVFFESSTDHVWALAAWTNYSTQGSTSTSVYSYGCAHSDMFLRMVYSAANTFEGYSSCDGTSWFRVMAPKAITLTPTKAGFYCATGGGTNPCTFAIRYWKFVP